ncbi:hypothetical protein RSOLAG22IIIB_11218 [Rhizoctonia solani]|uniref:Uncharacterized protein n=1 Tax=Rhizoctonia solani TaxID=456999 RepID=A0A0K6G7T1_9AGAM|nr:hypothetical protein RSOLAG22IIIB_11218 [Rhizoctonia solani]
MRTLFPLSVYVLSASALSPATVDLVKARLKDAAQKSWEIGTRAQALLELESPSVSVFTATSIPGSPASQSTLQLSNAARLAFTSGQLGDVIGISYELIANKEPGTLPLMKDGSSADPASTGVGMIVANWTEAQGSDFQAAARDQLTWLLYHVPRSSNGAISHRNEQVQLWSDYIYMVPPFLAYYGASTSNRTLVGEAYNQIKLYRDVLLDKPTGLWQHIRQGSFEDRGLWSTGSGWAAMGSMRVAATIRAAGYANEFTSELDDLEAWTGEILNGMWPLLTEQGLFYNYANDPKTFLDSASTALIAACTYRAAVMFNNTKHIEQAERVYNVIGGTGAANLNAYSAETTKRYHAARQVHHRVQLSHLQYRSESDPVPLVSPITRRQSQASKHITAEGWLTPVVNPHSFHHEGQHSAEGQAFVLMMYAARNDYLATQKPKVVYGGAANVVGLDYTGSNVTGGLNGSRNVGAGLNPGSGEASNNGTTERKNADYKASFEVGTIVGAVGAVIAWVV